MAKKGNQELTKQIKEEARAIKYCPATNNVPTKATWSAFEAVCSQHQRNREEEKALRHDYCQVCRGYCLPAELELIEVEQYLARETVIKKQRNLSKEQPMEPAAINENTCQLCNHPTRVVKKHLGQMLCSTCQVLMSQAKNKPGLLVTALKQYGSMPLVKPSVGMLNRLNRIEELADKILNLEGQVTKAEFIAGTTVQLDLKGALEM